MVPKLGADMIIIKAVQQRLETRDEIEKRRNIPHKTTWKLYGRHGEMWKGPRLGAQACFGFNLPHSRRRFLAFPY